MIAGITSFGAIASPPLTIKEDIGLQLPHDSCSPDRSAIVYSPNGKYFFVYTTRGELSKNQVEDSLRVYDRSRVADFAGHSGAHPPPAPNWEIIQGNTQGQVISNCRWTADSRGVAFLRRTGVGLKSLMFADLGSRQIKQLSRPRQSVQEFAVRDAKHFAYRASQPTNVSSKGSDAVVVGYRRSLAELLDPDNVRAVAEANDIMLQSAPRLWAANDGIPQEAKKGELPLRIGSDPTDGLALSPSGKFVVTLAPVDDVPVDWERLYAPPTVNPQRAIHAGHQDPGNELGVERYVQIDLQSGTVTPLVDGPDAWDAGWISAPSAQWSADGSRIVLGAAFLPATGDGRQTPCIVVIDVLSRRRTCVVRLKPLNSDGYAPFSVSFIGQSNHRLRATVGKANGTFINIQFVEQAPGDWTEPGEPKPGDEAASVSWNEGLNSPPKLFVSTETVRRLLWNPNPSLKSIALAPVEIFKWKTPSGRSWEGGLYYPLHYRIGTKYPLVIQTHGFDDTKFSPDGRFSTGNAAQSLAGADMFVLQINDITTCYTQGEEICAVDGYDAAVKELSGRGLIDPQKVGIEGFSWTCLWVTRAIVFGQTSYRAASITDGIIQSYMTYLVNLDNDGRWPELADGMYGPPFGVNLQKWTRESPIFNLDRTHAALQVVGLGQQSALAMWEPYAILRRLNRPADFLMLKTSEHLLTNPRARLASQEGVLDWFRFWLQGYVDPDPAKREQYARWEKLCELQRVRSPDQPTFCRSGQAQ